MGTFCKYPKTLNVSRSIDAANHDLEVRFWSTAVDVNNSLGRDQDACWLAGTAGVLGIAGNMLTISLSLSLLLAPLLHFHPLISHQRLTLEMWGYNCVLLTIPTRSFSFLYTCWLSLNLLSTPLVALPLAVLVILSSHLLTSTLFSPLLGWLVLHILALLINNPPAPSQNSAFPPALCVSLLLWRGCQTVFSHTEPFSFGSITLETWPLHVPLFSSLPTLSLHHSCTSNSQLSYISFVRA